MLYTANLRASSSGRTAIHHAFFAAALALPGLAQAALVSYDDFSAGTISPARWYGEEGRQSAGVRTENQRLIVSGQLHLQSRGYGDNTSNSGYSTVRNSLILQKSSVVTAMRATLTPRTASAGNCAGNATPTFTRGRLFGFFFNAGTPVAGSYYNEVFAGIQLYRASTSADGAGVLRVFSFIGVCTDEACANSTLLNSTDMGTTNLDTPITLQMTWDAANDRFVFQRDAQAAVNLAYAVADNAPSAFPAKRLEVFNQIAHCTASRPAANGVFDFDNVQTNSLAGLAIKPLMRAAAPQQAAHVDMTVGGVD